MPRLTQEVPKYRKHRASHQAIVEINGKRHYLGPWQSKASRVEYDRLITEWLSSGRSATFGKPEHVITITELVVAYLEYAKGYYGYKPRSEFTNMRDALRPVRRLYGQQSAREFGPLQLKAVREQILATGNSRTHINTKIGKIVRVFRWGVSEGLLPPDVPHAFTLCDFEVTVMKRYGVGFEAFPLLQLSRWQYMDRGAKTKKLRDEHDILLQTAYANNRFEKNWLKATTNELAERHKIKVNPKTVGRRLKELGIVDNDNVVRGQR